MTGWPGEDCKDRAARIKDIKQEDCAQVRIERLWWSFYLVWRLSSQEIPGPNHVLSCPSQKSRLLLALMMIEPVAIDYYNEQTSLLFPSIYCVGPGKYCLFNLTSSISSCTVFLYYVFGSKRVVHWTGETWWEWSEIAGSPYFLIINLIMYKIVTYEALCIIVFILKNVTLRFYFL
jgi:hypothetical protein